MIPAAALLDTSVLLRLMIPHSDELQEAAEAIGDAIAGERLEPFLLDLAVYEAVNVLIGKLDVPADLVESQLRDIFVAGWPLVTLDLDLVIRAAQVAEEHDLIGYDATFLAAAEEVGIPLISADAALVRAAGPLALALWDITLP